MRLYEFGDFSLLPDSINLADFKSYLEDIWERRHGWYEQPDRTEAEISEEQFASIQRNKQAFLNFDGRYIQARNYAGIIQFQEHTISLLPKIFRQSPASVEYIFRHIQFYLSYCSSIRFPWIWQKGLLFSPATLLPDLIHQFAVFTEQVLSEQPYLVYQEIDETAHVLRGQLRIPEYARNYLSSGQWHSLPTRHSPFTYDNSFNQIVKYTVQLVSAWAQPESKPYLQSLQYQLDGVSDCICTYTDCERVRLNPLREAHEQVLEWCRLFLLNAHPASMSEATPTFSWLIPMERLFEDFVTGFIQVHFPDLNVHSQSTTLFASAGKSFTFPIRNDIWLPDQSIVIDMKYKVLDFPKGIPATDLYQMLAYATARKASQVHLIYPQIAANHPESVTIEVQNMPETRPVSIHAHALPMMAPEDSDITEFLQPRIYQTLTNIVDL